MLMEVPPGFKSKRENVDDSFTSSVLVLILFYLHRG